jgi:hypothetical protein
MNLDVTSLLKIHAFHTLEGDKAKSYEHNQMTEDSTLYVICDRFSIRK